LTQLLANENGAAAVVDALRADGHDVVWIKEVGPGSTDDVVLALTFAENRVLLTFDKDFGELAFRQGRLATPGVILLRPRLRSPDYLVRFAQAVLAQGHTWEDHFAVAEEGRLRIVPLPAS
jgi:predicted nuclease of predicted toxin-antitoxin system